MLKSQSALGTCIPEKMLLPAIKPKKPMSIMISVRALASGSVAMQNQQRFALPHVKHEFDDWARLHGSRMPALYQFWSIDTSLWDWYTHWVLPIKCTCSSCCILKFQGIRR